MNWPARCAAVIPCLNEERALASVVAQVRNFLPTVIVVDDGSRDATAKQARQSGAQVIRLAPNQGKGAALSAGLEHARQLGFAWAITLDGDGQHAAEDIPRFFECATATGAALVVGNRMADAGSIPWVRRKVNRWMSWRLSKLAGRELPDTQSGFRLVQLEPWSKLLLRAQHFEIESEMILAFVDAGLAVEFVPIQVIYKTEQSKIHPFRDTWRWFRWLRTRRTR
jgi:glycosyltransferase involved in cell wall biosynthesis